MVCLDSSFLVDLLRGNDDTSNFLEKYESAGENIFVSSISLAELIKGAYLSANPQKEESKVKGLISSFLELPFNNECAFLAGKIEAELISKGEIIGVEDVMIAATAIQNNELLITRNKKHFEKIKELKIGGY